MTTLANYPLSYSEVEAKRLMEQGAMLEDLTADLLRRAGLAPGIRCLTSVAGSAAVGEKGPLGKVDRKILQTMICENEAALLPDAPKRVRSRS